MDLSLTAATAYVSANSNRTVTVELSDVSTKDLLDRLDIQECIDHFGLSDILDQIGIEDVKTHFNLIEKED